MSKNLSQKVYPKCLLTWFAPVAASGGITGAIAGYVLTNNEKTGAGLWPAAAAGAVAAVFFWQLLAWMLAWAGGSGIREAGRRSAGAVASVCILPVLYLPLLLVGFPRGAEPWPDFLPVPEPLSPAWQFLLVMAASGGLVLSMLAWAFPVLRRGPINWLGRHPGVTLTMLMIASAATMSVMEIVRTRYLHGFANTAMFTDALRNIDSAQGPLYSSMFQASGASLLGVHSSFIWYLVFPLFRLWPSPDWLLILANVALGLAAIPVYLLSRRFFGPGVSLLFAAALLLNRLVLAQPGAGEMSEERFVPLLFLTAFYFWQAKRFGPFALFAILMLTIREDMGIVLAILGIISLVGRRSLIWWLLAIALGAAWFAVMTGWLIPAMNPSGVATRPLVIYGSFGDSTSEIIANMVFKPWLAFGAAFSGFLHKITVYHIFLSSGLGLPLFSGLVFLALPAVAESLLTQSAYPEHINMPTVAATVFPAFIAGAAFVERAVRRKWRVEVAAGLVLVPLFSSVMMTATWFSPDRFTPRDNYITAQRIMDRLPPGASVVLPIYLVVRAEPTQQPASYYQVPYEIDETGSLYVEQDYVLLDMKTLPRYKRYYDGFLALRDAMASSPDFRLVEQVDDLYLYQRQTAEPLR